MYILTKRATADDGRTWHRVHGMHENVDVARAWYRSTRTTDVYEVYGHPVEEKALETWREQHAREALEQAALNGSSS